MKLVLVGREGWGHDEELKLLIEQMKDVIMNFYLPTSAETFET